MKRAPEILMYGVCAFLLVLLVMEYMHPGSTRAISGPMWAAISHLLALLP